MNKETANLLEQHFETAFSAPDGIKKLRELILTLAMQGRLVEQDPNDPPASELLKEIEAEKQRLIRNGKIKKSTLSPEIADEERAYEIPTSWVWVRFGDIAQHNSGKTLDKGRNKGQPRDYITTSNLYWGRFELDNVRQMLIREDELERCTARKNDLLICEGGEAGRAAVWHFDLEVCFQNHIHRARFYRDIDPYFAFRFFEKLNATGEINQHRKGVGISNMSSKALASIVFPLPPLPEQHRIVARIDQLMARCDELEKLRKEREEKRFAVHAAAISQLLEAPGTRAWNFIQQHFGELYTVKENVVELRKAILQLAVMGRLVPQDPNDPSASELLKEIEAEKQRLAKEGKIKKPKHLPQIKQDEVPFDLPKGWLWVRLGEVTSKITDGDHQTPPRTSEGYRLLSAKNVRDGFLDYDNCDFISGKHYQKSRERCLPEIGDLLIVSVGGTIGRTSLVPFDSNFALVRSVAIIKPLLLDRKYLKYSMDSPLLQVSIHSRKRGGAQPCLYLSEIQLFHFSLPPLPEQHRIVARIDQLMALCDQLDQQLDAATSKQTELLNAIMAHIYP